MNYPNFIQLITFIFVLASSLMYGQKLKEQHPIEFREIQTHFSDEFILRYNSSESLEQCEKIWEKMSRENIYTDDLSDSEREILSYCDEFGGNPWTRKFTGCSWYCGGAIDTIVSSSKISTDNIHDGDYGTVWMSDEKMEHHFIEYIFKPESSRVSNVIIVNGNVKTNEMFQEFSRVKKIKMYVNDKPYALLNLEDTQAEQVFEFKPIGHRKKNYEPVKRSKWKIKFEIIETYSGKKEIISISEIYFDGDGHE